MNHFEHAHKAVCQLVKDFQTHEKRYLSSDYSEAQARLDFIDKFFTALGWDVNHETQKNPYEQEVKVEKGVNVARAQKRADYAFCLAPNFRDAKFFVEAKKPAKALSNPDDYFQTARYGWNANTPIAVLTDFEEFHIIDCRFKPAIGTALNQKLKKYHYSEYLDQEKFAEIYWLFSHEAVEGNSLEKHAETLKKPTGRGIQQSMFPGGYKTIDEDFLDKLDEYRVIITATITKNNKEWHPEELTEATQRILDRLVFIRYLEDKLLLDDHYIKEIGETGNTWSNFLALCKSLKNKYNGIIFNEHFIDMDGFEGPDDDKFCNICNELASDENPYNFVYIPVHMLGSIYERFLGKIVTATSHAATIEDSPEKRKVTGTYYTPQYIVRYIVENTIGKIIYGKTPEEISKLHFADISCGSGSFLIGVFEYIIDHLNTYYQNNPNKAKKDGCRFDKTNNKWNLSIIQKQQILLNNVYGADIDQNAVEVTQLSLALKLLENETLSSINEVIAIHHKKVLPDMTRNIRRGNSLVGNSILQSELFDNKSIIDQDLKLWPMDFETAFPSVMKGSKFDAIVGNPPYVEHKKLKAISQYLSTYKTYSGTADLYVYFYEKAINILNDGGMLGYISSNKFFRTSYGSNLRSYISQYNIEQIIDFTDLKVFDALVASCIFIASKTKRTGKTVISLVGDDFIKTRDLPLYVKNNSFKLEQNRFGPEIWHLEDENNISLKGKIDKAGTKISNIKTISIFRGVTTGSNEAFIIDRTTKNKLIKEDVKSKEIIKPLLQGRNIKRWLYNFNDEYLVFIPWHFPLHDDPTIAGASKKAEKEFTTKYNAIYKHILQYKKTLLERNAEETGLRYEWYALQRCAATYYKEFDKEKIIWGLTADKWAFTYDDKGHYLPSNGYILTSSSMHIKYLLALLNSKLMNYYFKFIGIMTAGGAYTLKHETISELPIIVKPGKDVQNKLIKLVDQILECKKQLVTAHSDANKNHYEQKCQSLDNQLDKLVYELYGLTEEEIKVVEGVQ